MCQAYDLGIIAWSPLAHGVLAGRYTDAAKLPEGSRGTLRKVFHERITQEGIDVGFRFAKKSEEKEYTAAQLAVAWVLNQAGIAGTILGPRNLEQFEGLLPALDILLDDDDMKFFDSLVPPGRYVVNYFNTSGWMK